MMTKNHKAITDLPDIVLIQHPDEKIERSLAMGSVVYSDANTVASRETPKP
jgi:hypothetical protein